MADRLNGENQEVVGNPAAADPIPREEASNDENREEETIQPSKHYHNSNIVGTATGTGGLPSGEM